MSLPKGFKRLEYIQSSGTQYLDTGVAAKSSLLIRAKFNMTEATSYSIIGYYQSSSESFRLFNAGNVCYLDFGSSGAGRISGGTIQPGVDYEIEFANRYVKNLTTGQTIVSGTQVADFTKTQTVRVFGNSNFSKGKFYYLQIYDNGILVRDYIPCQNASGAVGLWDEVNSVFYGNAGTGTFTAGPEIILDPPASPTTFENVLAVYLRWSSVADATGYRVYRNGSLVGDTENTFFADLTAEWNQTYVYTLTAYNDGGESDGVDLEVMTKAGYYILKPVVTSANFQ